MNDNDLLDTRDATVWAERFCQKFCKRPEDAIEIDEGLMIAWFANAIETGIRIGVEDTKRRVLRVATD